MNTIARGLRPTPVKQTGFTIIELMIALAIGMILVIGIANIFGSNKKAYRYNEALAGMFDNGSFALDFINNTIAQAGYIPGIDNFPDVDANNDGKTDKADAELWAYGANVIPLRGTEGGAATSDSLTVNIFADPANPNPTDCVGNVKAAPGDFAPATPSVASFGITNTLQIMPGASGRPALYCITPGSAPVELVDGIERMEVKYGVDTNVPSDGAPDTYIDYNKVVDPRQIQTVRIALLVSSVNEIRPTADTKSYNLLGTVIAAKNDKRLRRIMSTTIKLRNRCARSAGMDLCI